MIAKKCWAFRDFVHALFCYQFLITPIPVPIEKEYQFFAERACNFLSKRRTKVIKEYVPRPYVLHHFAQPENPDAKKILITHGWMSRAAYMVRLISALHEDGYEVYALDFPAHGDAKGWRLPWIDSAHIIRNVLNHYGPFYGVAGHSYGGGMLLITLTLASQFPQWQIHSMPEKMSLLASPTSPRAPIKKLAKRFKLNSSGLIHLKNVISEHTKPELHRINYRRLMHLSKIPVLCIHGQEDKTVDPLESIRFCQQNPHSDLILLPDIDHVGVLIDERVERRVSQFFRGQTLI